MQTEITSLSCCCFSYCLKITAQEDLLVTWKYIVTNPGAWEWWGYYCSIFLGPSNRKAEDVFQVGTHTEYTYICIYVAGHTGLRQTLRASTWTQTAPIFLSYYPLFLDKLEVHHWDYSNAHIRTRWIHAEDGLSCLLGIFPLDLSLPASDIQTYEPSSCDSALPVFGTDSHACGCLMLSSLEMHRIWTSRTRSCPSFQATSPTHGLNHL